MGEIVEIHREMALQGAAEGERKGIRLRDLLKLEMEGGEGSGVRGRSGGKWKWKGFKLSLRLNRRMSCCGGNRRSTAAARNMEPRDDDEAEEVPVSGMNLMTALAAERQFREAQEWEANTRAAAAWATPRVSLIRLLQEEAINNGSEETIGGSSSVCSVCDERKKGSALIPCGHTFCRVCSREIWLNQAAACPLCSSSVVEILDIF